MVTVRIDAVRYKAPTVEQILIRRPSDTEYGEVVSFSMVSDIVRARGRLQYNKTKSDDTGEKGSYN